MTTAAPSTADVLEAVTDRGPPSTPVTTPEVAEEFDCTPRTVYNRLESLVTDGVLQTKKVGANSRVWWQPVDERGGTENQFIENEPRHTVLESRIDQLCERTIGVYTLDTELRFTYCNDQAETWLGTTETRLRGEFVWDAFNYVDIADDAYHEALESGEPTSYLNYDESLKGWFENSVYPTDSGLTVYFTDVTERKESERELHERKQESEQKYRTLFDSIDEGFCIIEMLFDEDDEPVDYRFLETNPAFEEQTGLVDAEGKRMRDLEPNHEAHWFETFGRVAKTGDPERFTERAEHLGDQWFDLYAFRIGEPEQRNVAVLFDNITERKRAEDELERTRNLLAQTERIADVAGWELDTETENVHWTDNLFDLMGFSDGVEPSLDEIHGVYHEDDLPMVEDALNDALELGKPYDIEARYQPMGDDELRWLKIQGEPDVVDGEVTTLRGAVQDVTERKHREEALKEREERLDAFVTATSEVVYHMSPDWSELYELDGRGFVVDTDEPRQNWLDDYIPDDEHQRVQAAINEAVETKRPFELEHRVNQADGSTGWAHSRAVPILDDDGEIIEWFGTASDITERKKTEKALRESEAELATELEATRGLQEISTELIQEDDIESLTDRVLDAAVGIVDADSATVQLYDPDREDLQLVSHRGLDEAAVSFWDRVTLEEESSCAKALETGERVVIEDVETCAFLAGTEDLKMYHTNGIRAMQTTPLVSRSGDLLGMFSTHWETPRGLLERELGHLDILARQTADLIERQQTMEALRESEGELHRLNTATRELIEAAPDEIRDHAAELVKRVLDVEYTALWSYDETTGKLEAFTTDSEPEPDADAIRTPDGGTDQIWQAFIGDDVVVGNDLSTDELNNSDQLLRSQLLIPLGRHGIVCAGSPQPNEFDDRTIELAETLGVTLEAAWGRAESEQELAHQNDELERLDELNGLIRQIDQALVHADTHGEIDEAVCNELAESERYAFAWIGQYDAKNDAVDAREWTGTESQYLEDLTESIAGSTDDPIMTALQTHEVQVIGDIATDARAAPWREGALERGARSCIHIPLVYDQSVYGILSVYGTAPLSDERETEVLAEFGQTIGRAINAVETKTVLQTDGTVELTLRIEDMNMALSRLARNASAGIDVEGVVPGSDEGLTVFFAASGASPTDLSGAAEAVLGIDDLTCLVENDDEALFRAQLTDSASDSVFIMQDAVVRSVTIDADAATFVVDLPHEASVSTFLDDLRARVPDVELLARQPRHRPLQTRYSLQLTLSDRLTARQMEILQLAYRSGFFESPRVRTGKELAETLGIAHSTFTYHLREAERRLCEMAFEAA